MPTEKRPLNQALPVAESVERAHTEIGKLEERIGHVVADLGILRAEQKATNIQIAEVLEVMRNGRSLSAREQEWVRTALAREARREKLYHAIVEKSLASLLVAAIVWAGSVLWRALMESGR